MTASPRVLIYPHLMKAIITGFFSSWSIDTWKIRGFDRPAFIKSPDRPDESK
jgi:hypothetical protein